MSKIIQLCLFAFLLSYCSNPDSNKSHEQKVQKASMEKSETTKKQLRHVVLFKYKESASAADIQKIEKAFADLPAKIPQIRDFEWGINNSPEGLEKGFTHCFFLTFDSEEDRATYLPHPDHKAFGAILKPHLEDVLVIDYWMK